MLWNPEKATSYWIGNQSPWSGSSDPFHRPAHSVAVCFLRLPPFRWTFRWKPLFYRLVQSCHRVVACFLRLPYVKRRLGAAFLQVQCSLSYYFLHSFRFAGMPLPPLIVRIRLRSKQRLFFFPLSHSLCCSLLFRSPVHALRYKRYTFLRPRFEGFLPSPPRLAAILAWLSSYIVRFYYLSPF